MFSVAKLEIPLSCSLLIKVKAKPIPSIKNTSTLAKLLAVHFKSHTSLHVEEIISENNN